EVLAIPLDLRAAVLAVEDLVALGDVERGALAGLLVDPSVADGEDLALLGLLLGGVGEDQATRGGLLLLDRLHDQAIAERLELHMVQPPVDEGPIWHSSDESAKQPPLYPQAAGCQGRAGTLDGRVPASSGPRRSPVADPRTPTANRRSGRSARR